MKMIATLILVFAIASSTLAQCPVPPTVPVSDVAKIAGRWYQIAGPTFSGTENQPKCVTADFTPKKDGNFNLTMNATDPDGSKNSGVGLVERTDNQNLLKLHTSPYTTSSSINVYLVDTDFDNYLAAYICFLDPSQSPVQTGVILSRANTVDAEKYAELTDLLINKAGVSTDYFIATNQKDCQY
uniref:Lipocalin/cytosolic fatty-acid binding domain-containing protein n=2 Tax=Tetranychus urticae TaxID=32264 RepID=T1KP48_TETUR